MSITKINSDIYYFQIGKLYKTSLGRQCWFYNGQLIYNITTKASNGPLPGGSLVLCVDIVEEKDERILKNKKPYIIYKFLYQNEFYFIVHYVDDPPMFNFAAFVVNKKTGKFKIYG